MSLWIKSYGVTIQMKATEHVLTYGTVYSVYYRVVQLFNFREKDTV